MGRRRSCFVITKWISPAILSIWLLHQWDQKSLEERIRRIHDITFLHDEITSTKNLTAFPNSTVFAATTEDPNSTPFDLSHLPIIDVIQPENTKAMILRLAPRNISKQNLLFHLIHTTTEENFGTMQKRCIESIFYHHPLATVMLHAKNMTDAPVKYLQRAGYDLQVIKYDIMESLKLLEREEPPVVDTALLQKFTSRVKDYASDREGFWYSNESNLLRLILLYLLGGIYLDTDTVVVNRLDDLSPNTIGYQNRGKKQLNGAILILEKKNDFTRACLKEFLTHFNNRRWGANGPALITRVYYSNPELWNIEIGPRAYFQYFGWFRIGERCYNNTNEEMVVHHLQHVRARAYIVHLNNNMGHTVREGSACECICNTFCLSTSCTRSDRCLPLISPNNTIESAMMPQNSPLTPTLPASVTRNKKKKK